MQTKQDAKKDETAVVKKDETAVVKKDETAAVSMRGFENTDANDIIIPFLKLMQPLSPEVSDDIAKPGDIVNSLTKENFGNSIVIIPIQHRKKRIKWVSRDDGGGIDCKSTNSIVPDQGEKYSDKCINCKYSRWKRDEKGTDTPPECDLYHDFPCILFKEDETFELVVSTFGKTSFKTGQKIVSLANMFRADLFAYQYKITTKKTKNDKGTFFVFDVVPAGKAGKEIYELAELQYDYLKNVQYTVHDESEMAESGIATDEPDPSADVPF